MPQLPSGLRFAISDQALFDHGGNWFKCPDGHFWYWTPDIAIMGLGPYSTKSEILQSAVHALAPTSIEEVKKYVHVLELNEDATWGWGGEWLSEFPKHRSLSMEDMEAWTEWVRSKDIQQYLHEVLQKCKRLAEKNHNASGMAAFTAAPE